jgi:hypothetical protein
MSPLYRGDNKAQLAYARCPTGAAARCAAAEKQIPDSINHHPESPPSSGSPTWSVSPTSTQPGCLTVQYTISIHFDGNWLNTMIVDSRAILFDLVNLDLHQIFDFNPGR